MLDNNLKDLKSGMVAVIGIPFDANSSYMQGAALAPAQIRKIWSAGAINLCSESGVDLSDHPEFIDLGDLKIDTDPDPIDKIESTVAELLNRDIRLISLGGDHAMTYPILKSYHTRYPELEILHLDAHPDLYESYGGSRTSHACPFARIMEEKLASRLVQMGIRTLNAHQKEQADRFGVEIIEMQNFQDAQAVKLKGPLYLSIDLDVLDPAFAPGVSHHEPGGMSTRQLIELVQGLHVPLAGADIVEFNPKRDPAEITAMVAVKILKEVAARMLELPMNRK
ncbi:MAG: agmatinase [Desulfobacterales bacterium]|jgi:arginase